MNKDLFIQSIREYTSTSKDVATDILSLKADYPYCQLLHALAARVSKDHQFPNQQEELQLAAVYAADRAVLKDVITGNLLQIKTTNTTRTIADTTVISKAATASDLDLAEEVIHDLERLNQLRHNFELLFAEETKPATVPEEKVTEPVVTSEASKSPNETAPTAEKVVKQPRDLKARKERIVAIAKALQEQEAAEEGAGGLKKKKSESGESLIEEIATNKQEISPENSKQKDQLNIIEQFIKLQPSISPNKEKTIPVPSGDLSTIKTGEFSDNIVSETLVEILIKQGKKEKAIEVLKKLIWKFPQKKAYFAAQIEDLKN